jgi:uncharacterized protein
MVTVRRLRWDPWNVEHIARHEVTMEEVEGVCRGEPLAQQSHQGRMVLIGPTPAGRVLAVILEPEGFGVYYPVTARPASRKERALYDQNEGGTSQ